MSDQVFFIGKLLFFSVVISVLIKFSGWMISIPPTGLNALLIVLTPFVLMVILLASRTRTP